jgi:hypothetical protein
MDAVRNLTPINLANSGAVRYSLKRWPAHLASGIGHPYRMTRRPPQITVTVRHILFSWMSHSSSADGVG